MGMLKKFFGPATLALSVVVATFVPPPVSALGPVTTSPEPSEVRQAALALGLNALSPALAPEPANLGDFLNPGSGGRTAAIRLGKALFWDQQAGSDGQACASCHFHAGADNRTKNQLNPGSRRTTPSTVFDPSRTSNVTGSNYTQKPTDFPFHVLQDPTESSFLIRRVLFDSDDVSSSQGVFSANFTGIISGQTGDSGTAVPDPVFNVGSAPVNVRRVESRNTPTVINAVFNFSNFWDGRAHNEFNGVNPFGHLDDTARVLMVSANGTLEQVPIRVPNASLASQAVGPPPNDLEMSFVGRSFPDIGRKLLSSGLRPLGTQVVDPNDSVLGPLAVPGGPGLSTTYDALIRQAFQSRYWSSPVLTNGYTQMESNFSLFWGLAIQLYEATLVSDQTPFDRFMRGDDTALTPAQLRGLLVFLKAPNDGGGIFQGVSSGACLECHAGPEFTEHSIGAAGAGPIEVHQAARISGGLLTLSSAKSFTDTGFSNIGVRPTDEDIGRGGTALGKPLSFTKQALQGDPFAFPLPIIGALGAVPPPDSRVTVDGAFKVPGLRNVELTGPYFHNGGQATIGQVLAFYDRDGDFSDTNILNIDPGLANIDLNPEDLGPLTQFLLALTDERVRLEQAPFDHPQIFVPGGHPGDNSAIAVVDPAVPFKAADAFLEIPAVGAGGRPAAVLPPLKPFLDLDQTASPAPPVNLSVTVAIPGFVQVNWTYSASGQVGFLIQRSTDAAFSADRFEDAVPANVRFYVDEGASAGVPFFYRVLAFNEAASSTPSNSVTVTPTPGPTAAPAAPEALDARLMRGPTQVDIVWTDRSDDESGFRIERSNDGIVFNSIGTVGASIDVFADTSVIVGSRYFYRVAATNALGDNVSDALAVDISIPNLPPANLQLAPVSGELMEVGWDDTTNNEIGWLVERSASADFLVDRMEFFVPNPSFEFPKPRNVRLNVGFDDATVVPGTYFYRVIAINDLGGSRPSEVVAGVAALPVPPPPPPPPAPVPVPGNGGGGGGGGGAPPPAPVSLSGLSGSLPVSGSGAVLSNAVLTDDTGRVSINLDVGVTMRSAEGTRLTSLMVSVPEVVPPAPQGKAILFAREFGPSGATFSPPITINLDYGGSTLAEQVVPESLTIAHWDGSSWANDFSRVDVASRKVSAKVDHFTLYAIIGTVASPPARPTALPPATTTPAASPPALTQSPGPTIEPSEPSVPTTAGTPVPTPAAPGSGLPWTVVVGIIAAALLAIGLLTRYVMKRRAS